MPRNDPAVFALLLHRPLSAAKWLQSPRAHHGVIVISTSPSTQELGRDTKALCSPSLTNMLWCGITCFHLEDG